MRVPTKSVFTTIGLVLAALVTDARGQVNIPFGPANYDHDLQIFAPLELDLDNLPAEDDSCGYFFSWDKQATWYSGEKVTVGDPDAFLMAELIYKIRVQDQDEFNLLPGAANAQFVDLVNNYTGVPVPDGQMDTYQITNALQNVPPRAGMAMGDRYQFGYRDGDNGWMVGILKGARLHETETYGFGAGPGLDATGYTNAAGDDFGPQAGADLRAFGFGSVPILFQTPQGYLFGFRDYLNYLADAAIGTQVGPIAYVGNYGASNEVGTGDTEFEFFRLTDDIDGDLIPGAGVIIDPITEEIIMSFTDWGDLHQFNIFFDSVTVSNHVKTDGIEAMWTHEVSNTRYMAKNQNNRIELSAGARYFRFYDEFDVNAAGSILGGSFWDTSIDNQIVGPQVALKWTNRRQRWSINTDVRFLFGYNVQDWAQTAGMGTDLIPSATNRPLFARATYTSTGQRTSEFSPVGELRVEASYHLTKSFALKAGYSGMYVGNVRRAATSVRYYLPTMGFVDSGTQDLVTNGFNVGVEFVH
jgi:hypothetical protein